MEDEINYNEPKDYDTEGLQEVNVDGTPIDTAPIGQEEVIQPEVIPGAFPAPFRSRIGKSTVDLSKPENEAKMKAEYEEWWNFGKKRFAGIVPYTQE